MCPAQEQPPEKDGHGPQGRERDRRQEIQSLSLRSRQGSESAFRHVRDRHRKMRPDGARRAHQDEERAGFVADLPPLVPRGHLRQLFDEHERQERSEEHTSELQSLMRISYAVFCLNKTTQQKHTKDTCNTHTKY